uniref:Reverse transcriptase domain-containing protein n=1 Tax=Trichobilharzia regenti TaxID=157069 RepID=A0AA85JGB3_TRIRE|nr:unnamed protein product [Trichobilharzia regenti]
MFADEFTAFAAACFENSLSIVTGDFNGSDCSFLISLGHDNIVNFATRLGKKLDLVFINDVGIYEAHKRAPLLNSDHCIIRVLPKIYSKSHKGVLSHLYSKVQQICYSKDNIDKLRCMLKGTNWDLFTEQTLDETITNTTDYLKFCFEICCPKETLFIRFDRLSSPYLKKLRRDKELLFKTNDKPGVKKLNILIKLEMKRLNVLYNQRFLSCKTPSNLWKLFKEITNGKRCISVPSLNVDTLNKSFIRSSVDTLPVDTNHIDNNFSGSNTLDVLKCLRSLKPSQSLGPDGIPAIVLRNCADILCYPLTNIFNVSFSGNVLPFAWKNIKIIPIPKPYSGSDIKFRPIAITSPFLKLMEKLLLLRLEPALKPFNDPKQFAYKHGISTLDAAVVLYHNVVSCLDKGAKYVRSAFLDYTSAFDSVPRGLLLNKLSLTQTGSWAKSWLHSYFSDRMQYAVYNGKSSSTSLTKSGVPQGAILSPFLFSFFLHDLPHSNETNFVKYADDLTVSLPITSESDSSKINSFLLDINNWSKLNGLILNPSKCQALDFNFKHRRDLHELISSHDPCSIDGTEIETKSSIKYLGFVLSSDLSWSSHILSISKKMFRLTFYIKKLRQSGINQPLVLQFLKSGILPIVLYCSPLIFPGLLKKDYIILRRVLNAVSRACGLPLHELANTIVERHINSCTKWAKAIMSDPLHPLYSHLSPCISSGRTRRNIKRYMLVPLSIEILQYPI